MAADEAVPDALELARRNAELLTVSAVAPQLARSIRVIQENMAGMVAASMAPMVEAIRIQNESILRPLMTLQAAQAELARQALTPLLEATRGIQIQSLAAQRALAESLTRSLLNEEFRQAVATAAAVAGAARSSAAVEEDVSELQRLAEGDSLDDSVLRAIDESIQDDPSLGEAIDNAVDLLLRERPWLTRRLARRMVVILVFLMWTALICGVSLVPQLVGLPAALGLASKEVADRAGRKFDDVFPPETEEASE